MAPSRCSPLPRCSVGSFLGGGYIAGIAIATLSTQAGIERSGGSGVPKELQRTVLAEGLSEPIALDVAVDGRVVLAERRGRIAVWHPTEPVLRTIASLNVFTGP